MTIVTLFNQHPEHTRFAPGCFDNNLGKEVDLKNEAGEVIGKAKIIEIVNTEDGINITYETDAGLGLYFDLDVHFRRSFRN